MENKQNWIKRALTFGCLLKGAAVLALALLVTGLASGLWVWTAYNQNLYAGPGGSSGSLVIRGGLLFDGTGAPPRNNGLIVVEDGRITCMGDDCNPPESVSVIDAAGYAILRGLIDGHVHFGARSAETPGLCVAALMLE